MGSIAVAPEETLTPTPTSAPTSAPPSPPNPAWLRDPREPWALAACVLANFVVVGLCFTVLFLGTGFLKAHPILGLRFDTIRAVFIAALVAAPATLLGRHARAEAARGTGVLVTERQMPELHAELCRACKKLGILHPPKLVLGRVKDGPATVVSVRGRRECVVLDGDFLFDKEDWKEGFDWIAFVLAGALGAIRLGHTRWWVEMLTAYARQIPGLRAPLLVTWASSRDRCAAYVVPEGIRGIVIQATGKDLIWNVDPVAFAEQPAPAGFWGWYSALRQKSPHLVSRAHALYEARLFDAERDREREAARRAERRSR